MSFLLDNDFEMDVCKSKLTTSIESGSFGDVQKYIKDEDITIEHFSCISNEMSINNIKILICLINNCNIDILFDVWETNHHFNIWTVRRIIKDGTQKQKEKMYKTYDMIESLIIIGDVITFNDIVKYLKKEMLYKLVTLISKQIDKFKKINFDLSKYINIEEYYFNKKDISLFENEMKVFNITFDLNMKSKIDAWNLDSLALSLHVKQPTTKYLLYKQLSNVKQETKHTFLNDTDLIGNDYNEFFEDTRIVLYNYWFGVFDLNYLITTKKNPYTQKEFDEKDIECIKKKVRNTDKIASYSDTISYLTDHKKYPFLPHNVEKLIPKDTLEQTLSKLVGGYYSEDVYVKIKDDEKTLYNLIELIHTYTNMRIKPNKKEIYEKLIKYIECDKERSATILIVFNDFLSIN